MYVYCVESFAHIECYSDCLRRRAIWLNPFSTVLFTVCSAVTVELCALYPCCVGVFGKFAVIKGNMLFSSVFVITERWDMGLYEVPLSMFYWVLGWGLCGLCWC